VWHVEIRTDQGIGFGVPSLGFAQVGLFNYGDTPENCLKRSLDDLRTDFGASPPRGVPSPAAAAGAEAGLLEHLAPGVDEPFEMIDSFECRPLEPGESVVKLTMISFAVDDVEGQLRDAIGVAAPIEIPGGWRSAQQSERQPAGATEDDGNGLTEVLEANVGTDPAQADTDGDGFDDGVELARGTDPLNEDDFPA
jgi:hypothetical protein